MTRPSDARVRRLQEIADRHDTWVARHLNDDVPFHPEAREDGDYNQHYLDVEASAEQEADLQEDLTMGAEIIPDEVVRDALTVAGAFHLPGLHDQRDHGRRRHKRPGGRGGRGDVSGLPGLPTLSQDPSASPPPGAGIQYDLYAPEITPRAQFSRDIAKLVGRNQIPYASTISTMNTRFAQRYGVSFDRAELRRDQRTDAGTYAYVRGEDDGTTTLGISRLDKGHVLRALEAQRFYARGTGSNHGMMAHEGGHALLDPDSKMWVRPRADLDRAMAAGEQAARAAYAPRGPLGKSLGWYARRNDSEAKAELFAHYHWGGARRPPWVVAWGQAFHTELGLDPTPFSDM